MAGFVLLLFSPLWGDPLSWHGFVWAQLPFTPCFAAALLGILRLCKNPCQRLNGTHQATRSADLCVQPEWAVRKEIFSAQFPVCRRDRHRGGGHPPTPATPPCVRVRTRRFELVTLASIDQRWKSERFEVSIGKPHREGFGPGQIPGAESAASRVAGQSRANPQF